MAKKSKTQRAKASAARAQKKAKQDDASLLETQKTSAAQESSGKKFKNPFSKKNDSVKEEPKKAPKKEEKKPAKKKSRLQFFKDIILELKRVTWPSKQDVIRWSGVVLAALVFFGLYIFILDNGIVTPVLVAISGLGA